jgi:hypothetical protein
MKVILRGPLDIALIVAYGPIADSPDHSKTHFWEALRKHIPSPSHPTYLLGDFNTRLIIRHPDEHSFMGPRLLTQGHETYFPPRGLGQQGTTNRILY